MRAFALGLLLSGGLAAGPIYRINFTGTITSGTATDFNLANNAPETVADLTGLPVSGWMDFDLGMAPASVVSVDGSGFTNTAIQSTGGPVFTSEHFVIGGFTPPATGFLPMPTTFDLAPIPSVPGSTVTQTQNSQLLRFSTKPVLGPQSVLTNMNFIYSWTGPRFGGGDDVALDLLIADGLADPHFFTVPPPGEIPTSWSVAPTGSNGVFTIALLFQDSTNPNHFGVTSNYSVSGGFTIDSASGSFLTPEPGTVVLVAIGLVVAFRARSAQSGEAATKARHAST